MVTSRAVVGSSHKMISGSQDSAIAIITRCRMPPENSCGYARNRRSGSGMPTRRISSSARSAARRRLSPRCTCGPSAICQPTRVTGLSALIGSWKIMAIFGPRSRLMSEPRSCRRSTPSSRISPEVTCASAGSTPRMARSVMLLPEPDSPTRPRAPPRGTSKETPSTARTMPRRLAIRTCRSRTSRIEALTGPVTVPTTGPASAGRPGRRRSATGPARPPPRPGPGWWSAASGWTGSSARR